MIGAEEPAVFRELANGAMREFWLPAGLPAAAAGFSQDRPPGDLSEAQKNTGVNEIDGCLQPLAAIGDFLVRGFVVRRSTVTDGGDNAIFELQPVIAIARRGLIGKA